jgi:hypothetical protein
MSRNRSGPSPLLIVAVGGLLVFGGYFVWIGFLSYLDDQGNITAQITREALASATARVAPSVNLPTLAALPMVQSECGARRLPGVSQ